MMRPDYRRFKGVGNLLAHSAKGSVWEDHKYIKRIDGTYYYPESYQGGRHLTEVVREKIKKSKDSETKERKENLSSTDIDNLANEVIRGKYGNGQQRKDLLGENYTEVQKRVNELMKGSVGSKKVSKDSASAIKKAEDTAKAISKKSDKASTQSKVHSGVDMNKVLSVYRKKR